MIAQNREVSETSEIDDLGNAVEQMLRKDAELMSVEYAGANNLIESGSSCWLQVALPGVAPGSLQLEVVGGKLTVHGTYHVAEVQGANYLRRQLRHGGFDIAYGLPAEVDAALAEAQYERGILTVWLPKVHHELHTAIKIHTIS